MCFQMLPKLSIAGDLSYSSLVAVPHARSCDCKTSVAESGTCVYSSAAVHNGFPFSLRAVNQLLCGVHTARLRWRRPSTSVGLSALGQRGRNVRWLHSVLVLPTGELPGTYALLTALALKISEGLTDRHQTDALRSAEDRVQSGSADI